MNAILIATAALFTFASLCPADTTNTSDPQATSELERIKLEEQKLALQTAQLELEKEREAMRLEEEKDADLAARTNALARAASQIRRVYLLRFEAITNACRQQTETRPMRTSDGQVVWRKVPQTQQVQKDGQTVHQAAYKFNIAKYITSLRQIDTSHCPRDFQQAFFTYVNACQLKSDYNALSLARDTLQTKAAVASPVGGTGFDDVSKRYDRRDTAAAWAEVQKLAIKYGVNAKPMQLDRIDRIVGKDINLEYDLWITLIPRPTTNQPSPPH